MKNIGILLLISIIALQNSVCAQISSVSVKVDGLTCSACSFATQKSILKLDFVDDVKMDLNSHIATVTFKPSKKVSVDQISKKVYDAGFSVGGLTAVCTFGAKQISDTACFNFEGDLYHFEQPAGQTEKIMLDGIATIKFIGEKYMSKSEYRKWRKIIHKDVCKQSENYVGEIYHVSLVK